MYTATLTALARVRDEWRFSIRYDDTVSGKSIEKHYRRALASKQDLRNLARREAAALLNGETTDIDIPIGATIDVTPDEVVPPPPPTQAVIGRNAWLADYRRLQKMLTLTESVPALLTAQAQTSIANLRASLAAGWLNSYLDNI